MKIALYNVTTTTKTGGVESFVWELARSLSELYPACQVDIIGGRPPRGFQMPHLPGVRVHTLPYIHRDSFRRLPILNRLYGLTKLLERLSFGLATLPLLARERYTVLHIQKPYDLPVGQLANRLFQTRLLFGCHGKDFFLGDKFWARGVKAAVSCSHYNAETVRQHYGVLPEVVYNGIDIDFFSPRLPNPALRAKFAAPEEFLLMQVGRQVRWKGVQYFIEAVALLKERGLPVRAILAGDGPYRKTLEKIAAKYNVTDRITFLGNVPNRDLPDYYACVDIVVGTSFANETFGISLCEAAACERPIVASDFGGFREVVQEGKTGYLYPPQDALELANRLELLLSDAEKRLAFGKAGREFVAANFTWPQVAERVYIQYKMLKNSQYL